MDFRKTCQNIVVSQLETMGFYRGHRNIISSGVCACVRAIVCHFIFYNRNLFLVNFMDIRERMSTTEFSVESKKGNTQCPYDSICLDNHSVDCFHFVRRHSFAVCTLAAYSERVSLIESETTQYSRVCVHCATRARYTSWLLPLRSSPPSSTKTKRFNCHNS